MINLLVSLAEGARFELADPLRGLQFSRLARSATPSPLQALSINKLCDISNSLFLKCRDICRGIPHESFDRLGLPRRRDVRIPLNQ